MRRTLLVLPVLGLFGAALGCQHIGGKNDCGANASDAVIAPPSNPYPYAPVGGASTVIPPANGKDVVVPKKDVVEPKKTGNESSSLPMIESEQVPAFKSVPPQN